MSLVQGSGVVRVGGAETNLGGYGSSQSGSGSGGQVSR